MDLKVAFSKAEKSNLTNYKGEQLLVHSVLIIDEDLSNDDKQGILKEYNAFRNQFSKRREVTKEESVRIEAKAWNSHIRNGKSVYDDPRKLELDLVLVDEGEGLVIDYIMERKIVEVEKDA